MHTGFRESECVCACLLVWGLGVGGRGLGVEGWGLRVGGRGGSSGCKETRDKQT